MDQNNQSPQQNPSQTQPPPPNTPNQPTSPPMPKKFPTKWLIIIGAIILLLLLSAGAYAGYNSFLKPQPYPTPTPTPQSPTPTPGPTADWKSYTNKDFGFMLKHPDYTIEDLGDFIYLRPTYDSFDTSKNFTITISNSVVRKPAVKSTILREFEDMRNAPNGELSNQFGDYFFAQDAELTKIGNTKVGGFTAVKILSDYSPEHPSPLPSGDGPGASEPSSYDLLVLVRKNDTVWRISTGSIFSPVGRDASLEVFYQILSTLRFIE